MKIATFLIAAFLFVLPWLLFALGGIPAVSPHVGGPVLAGMVTLMAASPLLVALFIRRAQRRAGITSPRLPVLVGAVAALANAPVILLCLFISLYRAAP